MGTSTRSRLGALALILGLLGCGGAAHPVDVLDACGPTACPDPLPPDDDDGETTGMDPMPASDATDDEPAVPSTGLPCDVLDVLQRECQSCHGEMPKFGAPMPLTSYSDLMVPALSDPSRGVHDVMVDRLLDEASPMPPGGESEMDPADRQVLLDWIDAGAPEDPESSCAAGEVPQDQAGPEHLPCEPDIEFLAGDGSGNGYEVPSVGADDLYVCFAFDNPVEAGTQGTAWAPVVDDERVVHHMVLYKALGPALAPGPYPCSFIDQLAHRFVAVWAPGADNLVMPEEAGLDLDGGSYILQMHYNNSAGHEDVVDRSGIAMCTTDEPRQYRAGSLTLGTFLIGVPPGAEDFPVYGRCGVERTVLWPETVNVALAYPHMHLNGRAISTKVKRFDPSEGGIVEETLLDVPNFDWNFAKGYQEDPPFQIHRGDEIITKCVYDNPHPYPLLFGEQTNAEMCLNFMLVYPIDGILEWNCGVVI